MARTYTEQTQDLPEEVQEVIATIEIAAADLREVLANNDYRTGEAPIYGALKEIVTDIHTRDHDADEEEGEEVEFHEEGESPFDYVVAELHAALAKIRDDAESELLNGTEERTDEFLRGVMEAADEIGESGSLHTP